MSNCKKKCLMKGCSEPTKYYVNYSRYHTVCENHIITENQFIICSICNNKIQCYADLEIKCKIAAKPSLSIPQNQNISYQENENESKAKLANFTAFSSNEIKPATKIQNFAQPLVASIISQNRVIEEAKKTQEYTKKLCNFPNCSSKKTRSTCKEHNYCDFHHPKIENYCSSCKCIKCKKNNGCYLNDCGPLCEKCIKLKICFVCASTDRTKLVEKCKHYLCSKHFNENYFCYCTKCSKCQQELVNINSSTLLCDNCNKKPCPQCNQKSDTLYTNYCSHEKCADCFNKPCNQCIQETNLTEVSYNTYPSNEINYLQYPICDICNISTQDIHFLQCQHKLCTNCIETYPALCQKHLLCALCSKSYSYCPHCWTCISCKKIVSQESPLCSHNLCEDCRTQAYCENAPYWYCQRCNQIRNSQIIICEHGFCQACETDLECKERIEIQRKQYYDYYYGNQIQEKNIELVVERNIIAEEGKIKCLFCKAQIDGNYACNHHPFCGKCEEITREYGCPYCGNYIENVQCKACNKLYKAEDLQRLDCNHIMCNHCLKKKYVSFTKTKCIECLRKLNKKCFKCHQEETTKKSHCNHGFCQNCLKENCHLCYRKTRDDNITLSKRHCKHINLTNPNQICDVCDQKSKCIICNTNKTRFCSHKICEECLRSNKSDFCRIDSEHEDINNQVIKCKATFIEVKISNCSNRDFGINKAVLKDCSLETNGKCSINSLCNKCKSERFCRVCKSYGIKAKKNCEHLVCDICIKKGKCKKCLYLKCLKCKSEKSEGLRQFNCGHWVCDVCKKIFQISEEAKECNHIVCDYCFHEDKCIICYSNQICQHCYEIEDLCAHKYCTNCRVLKSLCNCECDCECGENAILTFDICYHAVCFTCSPLNSCKKCDRMPCSYCRIICPNKIIYKCKKHILCTNCYNPSICYPCSRKNYCTKCKINKPNENLCHHKYCLQCLKGQKKLCECICGYCNDFYRPDKCISGHQICECLVRQKKCPECDKCSSCGRQKKANNVLNCKHRVCDICYEKKFCGMCSPMIIKCNICDYRCNPMNACEHGACAECFNSKKCIKCICDICGMIQPGKITCCEQNHKFCLICSPNHACNKCIRP
ncbi:hypothetical protein SteCoe_22125 [Stentor coeruleus]|uniref:RING-type domain-containing protein n=1 Tax=Stentor coeruleus TaxID=5963 RepID=A0A1R2BJZ4_9CILI|nr:hypothetical protein SteCoe_23398 [Stentor coeruleus]OMJ78111.1 hypothetical protein SteCoe_22125 [Stentor coeruleus]